MWAVPAGQSLNLVRMPWKPAKMEDSDLKGAGIRKLTPVVG